MFPVNKQITKKTSWNTTFVWTDQVLSVLLNNRLMEYLILILEYMIGDLKCGWKQMEFAHLKLLFVLLCHVILIFSHLASAVRNVRALTLINRTAHNTNKNQNVLGRRVWLMRSVLTSADKSYLLYRKELLSKFIIL